MKKVFVFALLLITVKLWSAVGVSVSWDPSSKSHNLTYTAPDAPSACPICGADYDHTDYTIYRTFGYSAGNDGWYAIETTQETSYTDYSGPGTWSYRVDYTHYCKNGDVMATGTISPVNYDYSTWGFIHDASRSDADGGQETAKQEWHFKYKLQDDCYVRIRIFEPGAGLSFTTDTEGFWVAPSTGLVKTLVDYDDKNSSARSFEMADGSWEEEEVWDCRDSSGNVVSNGIYWILIEAFSKYSPPSDPDNPQWFNFGGVQEYELRDTWLESIPVDILRIKNLSVVGIDENTSLATISYDINGDAIVKIIICESGTQFKLATSSGTLTYLNGNYTYDYTSGDCLPLNPVTGTVDGNRIIKYFKFYRKAGSQSESWSGKNEAGQSVSNGLYVMAISAIDGYGNHALDADGNDQPIHTTIPVDRTQSETASETDPPTLSIGSPSSGASITSLTSLTFTLSDTSGIDTANTTVSVTGPGGYVYSSSTGNVTQTTTVTSSSVTYTLTNFTPTPSTGTYTVTIYAVDSIGNATTYNTWTFTIVSGGSAQVEENFKASVKAYPQPANTGSITFDWDETIFSGSGGYKIKIYSIYGELVKEITGTNPTVSSVSWNLRNDGNQKIAPGIYIYKMKVWDSSKSYEEVKKAVIYR